LINMQVPMWQKF